jgi:hypothetical protein
VPFHLVRSATVPPVVTLQPVEPLPAAGTLPPAAGAQANPFLGQISLKVESMAEAADGYILMGSVQTDSDQYDVDSFFAQGVLVLRDASGAEIPMEEAPAGNDSGAGESQAMAARWAYKVLGKNFHGPLTLSLQRVSITPKAPMPFDLDIGPNPQNGQTWTVGKQLDLFGVPVEILSAQYVMQDDPLRMHGLEFSVRVPPALAGLQLNKLDDPNPQPGPGGVFGIVGDGLKQTDGLIHVGFLTNQPLSGTVSTTANVIHVNGPWTATWDPPVVQGAPSPTSIPQACLTGSNWQPPQAAPAGALPAGLDGMLLQSRGDLGHDRKLFLTGLDGSGGRLLLQGSVAQPTFSPDGKRLAFAGINGKLIVMDVTSGATTVLAGEGGMLRPLWSPDGSWIAFLNMGAKQPQVELIHPDGSRRRVVRVDPNLRDLAGWLPDSSALLVLAAKDDQQSLYPVLEKLELATGELAPVLPGIGVPAATLSPDGAWLAYQVAEFGWQLPWIYVSRPDGSERRLLSRLAGRWYADSPVWSPDGRWLMLHVQDMESPDAAGVNLAIDPATCRTVVLPLPDGEVKAWAP